jgi:hypothetical protein
MGKEHGLLIRLPNVLPYSLHTAEVTSFQDISRTAVVQLTMGHSLPALLQTAKWPSAWLPLGRHTSVTSLAMLSPSSGNVHIHLMANNKEITVASSHLKFKEGHMVLAVVARNSTTSQPQKISSIWVIRAHFGSLQENKEKYAVLFCLFLPQFWRDKGEKRE